MDEKQIKDLIQKEVQGAISNSRFQFGPVQRHTHNGADSPQISQNNIIQSVSVSGSISFAQEANYTIHLNSNFTPSRIEAYGNIIGNAGERFVSFGSANLNPSFYLQPDTSTSVSANNVQYPRATPEFTSGNVPLQSAVYFGADGGGTIHTLVSEGHMSSVEYPLGTIHARMTVTGFSRSAINITVSDLDVGWSMNINYVIT